jgi:hypothetical protein
MENLNLKHVNLCAYIKVFLGLFVVDSTFHATVIGVCSDVIDGSCAKDLFCEKLQLWLRESRSEGTMLVLGPQTG